METVETGQRVARALRCLENDLADVEGQVGKLIEGLEAARAAGDAYQDETLEATARAVVVTSRCLSLSAAAAYAATEGRSLRLRESAARHGVRVDVQSDEATTLRVWASGGTWYVQARRDDRVVRGDYGPSLRLVLSLLPGGPDGAATLEAAVLDAVEHELEVEAHLA